MGALTEVRDRKTIFRHTKIIATLGPATDDESVMEKLIEVGIDLVRLNFSHSTYEENAWRIKTLRRLSKEKHHEVGVIGDLQGAKIRLGAFRNGVIELTTGDSFCIDTNLPLDQGDQTAVGVTYKGMAR